MRRAGAQNPGSGFLLYVLLDDLVDGYLSASDEDRRAARRLKIASSARRCPTKRMFQRDLFELRERRYRLRRAVLPFRGLVAALVGGEVEWIDDRTVTLLRSVDDHALRVTDAVGTQREIMGNAVDVHLALLANKRTRIMKRMTSWAAILLARASWPGSTG